jgi:hypothetical protein
MSVDEFLKSSVLHELRFGNFLRHSLAEEFVREYYDYLGVRDCIELQAKVDDLESEKSDLEFEIAEL